MEKTSRLIGLFCFFLCSGLIGSCVNRGRGGNSSVNGAVLQRKTNSSSFEINGETVNVNYVDKVNDDYVTVSFAETDNLCSENEGMGWVALEEPLLGGLPSVGYRGQFPEVKSISLSSAWSCFEIQPGVYDWHVIDETIAYWAQFGKEFNLRVCTDHLDLNQGVKWGAPKWLSQHPFNVPIKELNVDKGIYFDLSNEVYIERLGMFLHEFASHFENEGYPYRKLIKVVEIRGYGMVGEWHSGWNEYVDLNVRKTALRNILRMWKEAWSKDKLLVVSCTYEFLPFMGMGLTRPENMAQFCEFMGYDYALGNGITFRRDGIAFALQEYDQDFPVYYYYLNTGLPLLGELGDGYSKHTDNDPYPLFEATNEALYKWRVNYNTVIGWVCQDFAEVIEKETPIIDNFNHLMGYRMLPSTVGYSAKVSKGDKLYLNAYIENDAMGKCWEDYDFSIYLENAEGQIVYTGVDPSFNPIAMNGGEAHYYNFHYDLPENLQNGIYTIKFAISDSYGNPRMVLPIAGNDGANRYYLGEVKVGATKAVDLNKVDRLTKNETNFIPKGDGAITARGNTVDGSSCILGGGNGVFAQGQKLENGETYYISFDYKTNKDPSKITILDDSKYKVGAYSADQRSWGDSYSWLDVSNKVMHRTAIIDVPSDGENYYLAFGGTNDVAEIAIDNIIVNLAKVADSSFRINPTYAEKNEDGSYSLLSTYVKNWADCLQLKEKLLPHTAYMLSFDAKTTAEIGSGSFFYTKFTDKKVDYEKKYDAITSFDKNRIGSFYTLQEMGYQKYSYLFNTGDLKDDKYLAFGIYGIGGYNVKNIKLTAIASDYDHSTEKAYIKHNERVDKNLKLDVGDSIYENFESGFFNGGIMYPGLMTTGIMTSDQDKVISGKYSAYIDNTEGESSSKAYLHNIFLNSNDKDIELQCGQSYRVSFKFKITKDFIKTYDDSSPYGAYFYFIAREVGTYTHDRGYISFSHAPNRVGEGGLYSDYEVGKVYTVETEFTTVEGQSHVQLQWGAGKDGAVVIDDIVITRIANNECHPHATYSETPLFPEELEDKVLYDYVFKK